MKKIYGSSRERQAAYRRRDREGDLLRRLDQQTALSQELANELGALRGETYITATFPIPKTLAKQIRARELEHGIPAGRQIRTFTLAGAELICRSIDLAVAKRGAPVSPKEKSGLVERLPRRWPRSRVRSIRANAQGRSIDREIEKGPGQLRPDP